MLLNQLFEGNDIRIHLAFAAQLRLKSDVKFFNSPSFILFCNLWTESRSKGALESVT